MDGWMDGWNIQTIVLVEVYNFLFLPDRSGTIVCQTAPQAAGISNSPVEGHRLRYTVLATIISHF